MFNNEMTNKYSKDINSENYMNGNTLKNNLRNNLIFDSSNILLNSLKFFFDAYETKNQQKSSKIKFIISFEEIISLINETLISQQKVDNFIFNDKSENSDIIIQKINQKFISYLSNSIYTLEIYENNYLSNQRSKRNNSNINFYNLKIPQKKRKHQSYKSQISSPSNIKNKINYIFENIYQEVFINDDNQIKNTKKKKKDNQTKTNNYISNDDRMQRTKSAILGKKNNSPLNYYVSSKNNELDSDKNKRLFKTSNGNNININTNTNITFFENKYNSTSSTNKRMPLNGYNSEKNKSDTINFRQGKKNKKKEKNKLKCSDIYLACENISKIKSIGTMKTLRRNQNQNYFQFNEFDDKDSVLKKSLNNIARGIKDICSNSNEIIGYEEINLKGSGIKKIIVSNTHKPSNFTNQLLISGKKCINEFKELNQEEVKRKINNYPL